MNWVTSYESLLDFLSIVIVYAPNGFPQEDFLPPDDQLDLERSFNEISFGMKFVRQRIKDKKMISNLELLLDEALAAYQMNDEIKGARILQNFEQILIQNT